MEAAVQIGGGIECDGRQIEASKKSTINDTQSCRWANTLIQKGLSASHFPVASQRTDPNLTGIVAGLATISRLILGEVDISYRDTGRTQTIEFRNLRRENPDGRTVPICVAGLIAL